MAPLSNLALQTVRLLQLLGPWMTDPRNCISTHTQTCMETSLCPSIRLDEQTYYRYATNDIDLTEVLQQDGTNLDVLEAITYNSQHLPLTVTDAAGQVTDFGYNAYGQLTAVTNPLNQTATLFYDTDGYLTNVVGSETNAMMSFTYDSDGRVETATDSDGYTLSYTYDDADRITES